MGTTKADFKKIVTENKDKYGGITIRDATVRAGFPHLFISIFWKNTSHTSVLKTIRGNSQDLKSLSEKAKKEKLKYENWANEVLN